MASTITFSNLFNGQEILLPFEVNGSITTPSSPTTSIIAVAKQIDDNPLQDAGGSCLPAPASTGVASTSFAFELTTLDCPQADTYYMLSLYVWDNQDAQVTLASVTFKTGAALGGMPLPPSPPAPPWPPPSPPGPPPRFP